MIKANGLATEGRTSGSICHGLTRKNTEKHGKTRKRQKQRHGRENKKKHLPRINTEFHGRKN